MSNTEIKLKDRIDRFIEEYPKHKGVKPAAIAAGYGRGYAHAGQKKIVKAAERRLRERAEQGTLGDLTNLDQWWDIGQMRDEYMKILKQDKDFSTKEKAIRPILQKHGILPKEEEKDIRIPQLHIGIVVIGPQGESPVQSITEPKRVQLEPEEE